MAANVRAKFTVRSIAKELGSFRVKNADGSVDWKPGEVATVTLTPVTSGSAENDDFYASTPSGEMKLAILNPDAAGRFKLGQAFYVDFTPADE